MVKKLWNQNFILLLQGTAVSMIGDLMYSVAIGYWVYQQTGSNSLMGVMSSISMFVTMFLAPFSGTIVDKLNRKGIGKWQDMPAGKVWISWAILLIGSWGYCSKERGICQNLDRHSKIKVRGDPHGNGTAILAGSVAALVRRK